MWLCAYVARVERESEAGRVGLRLCGWMEGGVRKIWAEVDGEMNVWR
jgi:hypothetical protein